MTNTKSLIARVRTIEPYCGDGDGVFIITENYKLHFADVLTLARALETAISALEYYRMVQPFMMRGPATKAIAEIEKLCAEAK